MVRAWTCHRVPYQAAHNCLYSSCRRSDALVWPLQVPTCTCTYSNAHTNTHLFFFKGKVREGIDWLRALRITHQKDSEKLEGEGGQFSRIDEKQFGDKKDLLFFKY